MELYVGISGLFQSVRGFYIYTVTTSNTFISLSVYGVKVKVPFKFKLLLKSFLFV